MKATSAWIQKMRGAGLLFADLTKNNDTICNHNAEPKEIIANMPMYTP